MTNIEEFIKTSITEYIQENMQEIIDNFINEDPDWFQCQMSNVVNQAVKKTIADKSNKVIKEIIKEIATDYLDLEVVMEKALKGILEKKLSKVSIDLRANIGDKK